MSMILCNMKSNEICDLHVMRMFEENFDILRMQIINYAMHINYLFIKSNIKQIIEKSSNNILMSINNLFIY